MFSISDYLKDWYNTTRSIVMHPRSFFREMPVSGGLRDPLEYMLVTVFIASLLTAPMFLIIYADGMETSLTEASLVSIGVVIFLLITIGISLPMNALVYHFLLKISSAKGNLKATIRVYCYYMAAGIVVLPAFGIMMLLSYIVDKNGIEGFISDIVPVIFLLFLAVVTIYFSVYVLTVGFSEVHGISMKRVFLGVFGIPLVLSMFLVAIPMLFVFSSGFSTEVSDYSDETAFYYEDRYGDTMVPEYEDMQTKPTVFEPTDETITAVYGSTPLVDGYYTSKDKWDEAEEIPVQTGDTTYTIAAKHDKENLYLLLRWKGDSVWDNSIIMYFEQDGVTHDHNLENGREDSKRNGHYMYGPSNFIDSSYDGDVNEIQNGMVAGNYSDGFWVQEWVLPLKSNEETDINVESYPTVLGFAVSNIGTRTIWPAGFIPIKPETWGDLEIVE